MNNEELQNKIRLLEEELEDIKNWKKLLEAAHSIPLNIDQAFKSRFIVPLQTSFSSFDGVLTVPQGGTGATTLTGILLGVGTSTITAVVPLSGSKVYYVSDTSGGPVTRKLTFTSGVLTSET